MKQPQKTREIQRILLFAAGLTACGMASSWIGSLSMPGLTFWVGLPFSLLCSLVCARSWQRVAPAVAVMALAWWVAFSTAVKFDQLSYPNTGMYVAGLVGGGLVGVGMVIGSPGLSWFRSTGLTGLVGMASAWPFTLQWPEAAGMAPAFVVWQVSVGLCVYALTALPRWRGEASPGPSLL